LLALERATLARALREQPKFTSAITRLEAAPADDDGWFEWLLASVGERDALAQRGLATSRAPLGRLQQELGIMLDPTGVSAAVAARLPEDE